MRRSSTTPGPTLYSWLLPAVLVLAMLPSMAWAVPTPTIYTVGPSSDPDCDYNSLRDALAAAATQDDGGFAAIQLTTDNDKSLAYTWHNKNSSVVLNTLRVPLAIVGGYHSCSAADPIPGHQTSLTYVANTNADAGHTMLSIGGSTSHPAHVSLNNIVMHGAGYAGSGGPVFGGGLNVNGTARVTLKNSTISGFHASTGGGGVALIGSGTDPENFPKLVLMKGSSINDNSADYGGGIYSYRGRVVMNGGAVIDNSAQVNGGGIYLLDTKDAGDSSDDSHFALVLYYDPPIELIVNTGVSSTRADDFKFNRIIGNSAGSGAFSTTSGLGGGIYSKYGQIRFKYAVHGAHIRSKISANSANIGGGIYIEGPDENAGGPFTDMILSGTTFDFNTSRGQGGALYMRNAVAGKIYGYGGECQLGYGTPHPGPCMNFYGNKALGNDGGGAIARGGAIYLHHSRTDGASRPALQVLRTWFDANADTLGLAAVAAADGAGDISFTRSIFTNNDAKSYDGANSALVYTHTGKGLSFRYNTVLDSNTSTRMFSVSGGTLDVTGSILWGTVDRSQPFHFVWFEGGGANMVHNGCLLVRDSDGGTAGVPPGVWSGYAPDLDRRFAPRGSSAAIDHCDAAGGNPSADAYGHPVQAVPGVIFRYGNYDLGAVEQDDIIFTNSFGYRPTN